MTFSEYENLPDPLTPADVNMASYPWFRHYYAERRTSKHWLACKRFPEVGFYKCNMIDSAWSMTPAGSIEDNDDVLADAAMCDPTKFSAVKEMVMTGWLLCSDGRWYNLELKKVVDETLESQIGNRNRTAGATATRARNHQAKKDAESATNLAGAESARDNSKRERDDDVTSPSRDRHVNATSALRSPDYRLEISEKVKDSDASHLAPAGAVPDLRKMLWGEGVSSLCLLSGKPDKAIRTYLGKCLRELRDDCAVLFEIIETASATRPIDPIGWISAAVKARSAPAKQTFEEKMMEAVGFKDGTRTGGKHGR